MAIMGKPLLIDKLDAELAPKISEAIIKDNERARKARAKRAKRAKRVKDAEAGEAEAGEAEAGEAAHSAD